MGLIGGRDRIGSELHRLGRFLQVRSFFGHDRVFHGANLQADAAINAGRKINPVEVGAFGVLGITRVNASDWASIDTIGNTFTSICNDGMRHGNALKGR